MAGAILFERAQALSNVNREEGISLLNKIVREQEIAENDEELIRIKEQGILQLGELYKQEGKAKELADLIKVTRPFLSLISKAKAAKLVRSLVDMFLDMEAGTGIEVSLERGHSICFIGLIQIGINVIKTELYNKLLIKFSQIEDVTIYYEQVKFVKKGKFLTK